MFLRSSLLLVIIFGMILTPHLTAQESKKTEGQKQQSVKKSDPPKKTKTKPAPKAKKTGDKKPAPKALELKDLFPEKSMFGPSASRMAFSTDGRYAAYLYRPYKKRRHGSDLWLYDFQTDQLTQLTNLTRMSEFQRSAREVRQDRLAKHKKDRDKKKEKSPKTKKSANPKKSNSNQSKAKSKTKQELEEERKIVESVSEKDADDEKAPRYSGVSSFRWHPQKNTLLLGSEGDIYLLDNVAQPKIQRLTKTSARESSVEFLPDGTGYTYSVDDTVMRVHFDQHMIEQINPKLASGQRLRQFTISPDGKRLAIVAQTGERSSSDRTVDIIRYRDRFAKSDSVSRTVSDDKVEPRDVFVYLFDLDTADTEESKLIQVFETKIDEPRDVISTPNWSLDSQKVTFCFFNQKDSEVQILLATFPDDKKLKAATTPKTVEPETSDDEASSSNGRNSRSRSRSKNSEIVKIDAKVVNRFKHYGGPNTPRMVSPDFAGDNQHIVFISEQSGFRHVHILDPLYESMRQLTSGNFEVYPIRFSKDHKTLFVTSTKESPARQMVYSIDLGTGEMKRLNKNVGNFSSVAVNNAGNRMMANFVRYGQLSELVRQNEKQEVKTLTDSHPAKARELTRIKPEFFDYTNRHGHTISGMMFKPKGWTKKKKHPLLIYVYGGPLGSRHSVNDGSYSSDGYFFQMYMAQKHGYVSIVVDPRGQSGYGGLFEKSNYEQVGKPQVEDLVDGVKYMTENYNIDDQHVALYGWSFGGFQTQMCLYTEPKVFQVGMAGAGPTEWENYNSWYTTGTIGPSRTGEPDQKKYSLIPLAKNLEGQMLLVHGMEDTNVLFQDTVAVYRALLKAGKETNVELFLDPTGGHGLGGDIKRLGRMRKYEQFLLRTNGKGN